MENEFLQIIFEFVKLISTPNIDQYVKEKTIKELVCRSVDIQPNFGAKTKRELKLLIEASRSEIELLDFVLTYMSTHNANE